MHLNLPQSRSNSPAPLTERPGVKETEVVANSGIVLTDLSLKVLAIDSGATAILRELSRTASGLEPSFCLPASVADALKLPELRDHHGTTIHLRGEEHSYECRVYFLEPRNGVLRDVVITLYFETIPSRSEAIRVLATKFKLTIREEQVLAGIAAGLTNKEIAEKLDISPNTVKAFLHPIMIKMGVSNRAGIVMCLVDSGDDNHPLRRAGVDPAGAPGSERRRKGLSTETHC